MPNSMCEKSKFWLITKKIMVVIFLVMISPIAGSTLLMCFGVPMWVIFEWIETTRFNLEILPVVSEQITDPKVRLELNKFEEIMMPQFYVEYAPGQEVRFHTVIGSGANRVMNESPLVMVETKDPSTGELCNIVLQRENYDFLQDKSEKVTEKLLAIYDNRQKIIDDFVGARPECFQ